MEGDDELAQEFEAAMLGLYDTWRTEIGYVASRFRILVANHGGVGAARRLLQKPGVSAGFARLSAAGRLELTVEYLVLRREYGGLFSADERGAARRRLTEHGMRRDQLTLEPYAVGRRPDPS